MTEEPHAAPASAKGETTVEELTRVERTVARRVAESRATVPDFELRVEVDMDAAAALRAERDPAPSYTALVVKAAALALAEFPRANGAYRDGRFETFSRVNVGVAVAADDGLAFPTIFDADAKSLDEIGEATRALAARVRDGSISQPEMSGATFTVSNLGMFAVDSFTAIINMPQAANLSVGAVRPRAVVNAAGAVVARRTAELTLACDHRILYGAAGARFLGRIRELLEAPAVLAA